EDHFVISDLGSRNGTFVNGVRLTAPRRMEHGDVVGIGLSKLTFRMAGASDTNIISVGSGPIGAQPPPLTEESLKGAVVAAGLVPAPDLETALANRRGRRLSQVLTEEKLVPEEGVRDLIGRTFRIPTIDLKSSAPDSAIAVRLSASLA